MPIYFDLFRPNVFSHWLIAFIQLLHGDKYWWVCHVTIDITATDELQVKCLSLALDKRKPHDRELIWYNLVDPPQLSRIMFWWLPQRYFMNCAYAVSMLTKTPIIFTRPSLLYEASLQYVSTQLQSRDTKR